MNLKILNIWPKAVSEKFIRELGPIIQIDVMLKRMYNSSDKIVDILKEVKVH